MSTMKKLAVLSAAFAALAVTVSYTLLMVLLARLGVLKPVTDYFARQ